MRAWPAAALLASGCSILFEPSAREDAGLEPEDAGLQDGGGAPADGAELAWLEPWAHRKEIAIDAEAIASPLEDFPVLILFSDDEALSQAAQQRGNDLRFTDSSGTAVLDHEVESFDAVSGELIAWVKVPALSADSDTVLFLYYGNDEAPNAEDAPGVWSNGFARVYHLEEMLGPLLDATGNDDAELMSGDRLPATGKIGFADDMGVVTFDAGSVDLSGEWTISAWIKNKTFPQDLHDFHILAGSEDQVTNVSAEGVLGYWDGSESTLHQWDGGPKVSAGEWDYYVWAHSESGLVARVNGVDSSSGAVSTTPLPTSTPVEIGSAGSDNADEVQDEVRVADVFRSTAWTEAEYANMADPASFYTVGLEESREP